MAAEEVSGRDAARARGEFRQHRAHLQPLHHPRPRRRARRDAPRAEAGMGVAVPRTPPRPRPSRARLEATPAAPLDPLAGGCQLGRDIPAMLAAAGFTAEAHLRPLHRPQVAGYHYWPWAGRG